MTAEILQSSNTCSAIWLWQFRVSTCSMHIPGRKSNLYGGAGPTVYVSSSSCGMWQGSCHQMKLVEWEDGRGGDVGVGFWLGALGRTDRGLWRWGCFTWDVLNWRHSVARLSCFGVFEEGLCGATLKDCKGLIGRWETAVIYWLMLCIVPGLYGRYCW